MRDPSSCSWSEKGHGFAPAVNEPQDQMHSTGAIDPVTGVPKGKSQPGWTAVFSEELIAAAEQRDDIVAITAAMAGPTEIGRASCRERVWISVVEGAGVRKKTDIEV